MRHITVRACHQDHVAETTVLMPVLNDRDRECSNVRLGGIICMGLEMALINANWLNGVRAILYRNTLHR